MSNITVSNSGARLRGIVWVVGVVALLFTLISLAPVISHFG
jgi:hypothetical protein